MSTTIRRTGAELPSGLAVFTIAESAYLAGASRAQVADLVQGGEIKGYKIGREYRVPRDSLIAWMKKQGIPLDICLQGLIPRANVTIPRDLRDDAEDPSVTMRLRRAFEAASRASHTQLADGKRIELCKAIATSLKVLLAEAEGIQNASRRERSRKAHNPQR